MKFKIQIFIRKENTNIDTIKLNKDQYISNFF